MKSAFLLSLLGLASSEQLRGSPSNLAGDLCIVEHCGLQGIQCGIDTPCRTALTCITGCKDSQTCIYDCENRNADAAFDKLFSCMLQNNCIPHYPAFDCVAPTNTIPFHLSNIIDQKWWLLKGVSPAYDCFPCQEVRFTTQADGSAIYESDFMFAPNEHGHLLSPIFDNTTSTGTLELRYQEHGLSHSENWHFVSAPTPDYALFFYCGHTQIMDYGGGLVMGKNRGPIPAEVEKQFIIDAKAAGYDYNAFCPIESVTCVENWPSKTIILESI